MPQPRSPIVERLKAALRAQYDAIVNEPLPERWVDLIKRLMNKSERSAKTCKGQCARAAPAAHASLRRSLLCWQQSRTSLGG